MRFIRQFYWCIFFLVLSKSVYGQQKDFRTWCTIEVEGELFNLIDFSVAPEVRFWDNSSRFDGLLTEADLSVPIIKKYLRIGLNYRYQADFEDKLNIEQTNRFGIYGELSQKLRGFKFTYRAYYLREYTDMYTSEKGPIPLAQHRHKLTLRYKNKQWKISPYVSAEMFYTLSPAWNADREKLRISTGIRYALTKKIDLGVGYKYQQEYYENNPLTSNILSVEFNIEL
jgi:hypothetical protein